jgi:hypothetical protein
MFANRDQLPLAPKELSTGGREACRSTLIAVTRSSPQKGSSFDRRFFFFFFSFFCSGAAHRRRRRKKNCQQGDLLSSMVFDLVHKKGRLESVNREIGLPIN